MTGSTPVTIGMPLFNNSATVRRAIESLLSQSYRHFTLVASDDNSSDGTADICDEYARTDPRLVVFRQARNLNYGNFRFVLRRASTAFFMYAAGDDWWHPDYLLRAVEVLEENPRAVCVVSEVEFVHDGTPARKSNGTYSLTDDPATNLARFLAGPSDNSRMYGLFRTNAAQRAFPPRDFYAYDWAFCAGTLREGQHLEIPEVLMWREDTLPHRYIEYVRRDARGLLSRLFPMLPLTRDLIFRLRIPFDSAVLTALVRMNIVFHLEYLNRYHPRVRPASAFGISAVLRLARAMKALRWSAG